MKIFKSLFLSFCLLLTLSTGVKAEFFTDVIVTSANGIWTDSRAYSTLNAAITAVGANQRNVKIVSPQVVTALTIPSNVTLEFDRDGSITNSGQLTIQTKNIIAPNRQIFTGVGNIDFASGTTVKSGWFSNIETAFALTSNDTITLLITKPQTITASYSPGNNVVLSWEGPGNILTVNAGVTVSNIGQVVAGNYQLFAGAGNFRFRDGTVINLEWFNNLRSAITYAAANTLTLEIQENYIVDLSDSVPATLTFKFFPGGTLSISPGVTLTFADYRLIDIGHYLYNPFLGNGSVTITGATTYTPASSLTASILKNLFIRPQYVVDALYDYGNSVSYTQATIAAAIAAIGADNAVLLLRSGTWPITDNLIVPSNVTLEFAAGALLTIANTKTLTINGSIKAFLYQIFSCIGSGAVVTTGKVESVYPNWFGVNTAPGTTDMFAAIQAATNAGKVIQFIDTEYAVNGTILYDSNHSFKGLSKGGLAGTVIITQTGGGVATFQARTRAVSATFHPSWENLTINNSDVSWPVGSVGVDLTDVSFASINKCSFRRHEKNVALGGTLAGYYNTISNSELSTASYCAYFATSANSNTIIGGRIHTCTFGVYGLTSTDNYIRTAIETCQTGVYLGTGTQSYYIDSRFEGSSVSIPAGGPVGAAVTDNSGSALNMASGSLNHQIRSYFSSGVDRIIDDGLNNAVHTSGVGGKHQFSSPSGNMFWNASLSYDTDGDGFANGMVLSAGTPAGTTISLDTVNFVTGTASQLYTVAAAGSSSRALYVSSFPTTPGVVYNFATRVKTDFSGGWNLRIGSTGYGVSDYRNTQITMTGQWYIIEGTFRATTNTAFAYFITNGTVLAAKPADAHLWIDSIYFGVGGKTPMFGDFLTNQSNERLLSITNIPLNADGDTTIYTVPAGYRCILTRAYLIAGADAVSTDISIGQNGATTDWVPVNQLDNLDAANDFVELKPYADTATHLTPTKGKAYPGATVIKATVANNAGGATNTLLLYGILF